MTIQKKQWVSWEELIGIIGDWTPATGVDIGSVGGLAPGSIPFADASGFLTEDNATLFWDDTDGLTLGENLNIRSSKEIRFYDNGNYVGFKAPALDANQIWVLPDEDGDPHDLWATDGAGNIIWRKFEYDAAYKCYVIEQ